MSRNVRRGPSAGLLVAFAAASALALAACGAILGIDDVETVSQDGGAPSSSGAGGKGGADGSSSSSSSSSGIGGAGGQGGHGGGCTKPSDCPAPQDECLVAACTAGACGTANAAKDKPLSGQTPGDCQQNVCDGNGGKTQIVDDLDLPVDATKCTDDLCTNGVPTNPPVAVEAACSDNGGTVCDGSGTCVECVSDMDCKAPAAPVCKSNQCVSATCSDGKLNGDETDKDCGGSCTPCADTLKCMVAGDCQSKVCNGGTKTCTAPTCGDSVLNGDETDVDCGGGTCPGCAYNKNCSGDTDCIGGLCTASKCVATCTDTVKNGSETDVDCGGATCSGCADGKSCTGGSDCAGGACTSMNKCCTPVSLAIACAGKCGASGVVNNCGKPVDCSGNVCTGPGVTCGGGGVANVCGCTNQPATTTCNGKCGAGVPNNCGNPVDCTLPANMGTTCVAPQTCSLSHLCGCVDEPPTTTCNGKCGAAVPNNCGNPVDCTLPANGGTMCSGTGVICGGGGVPHVCGCTPDPLGTTCNNKNCGTVTNNCGMPVTCGPNCSGMGVTCGGGGVPNVCGCTPDTLAITCQGKACGTTVNNCGTSVVCPNTCTAPNTCGGGAAGPNGCGCTPDPFSVTCSGKMCGTVADNCNNTVTCGACGAKSCCNFNCTDENTDPANCGFCGNPCQFGKICMAGACCTANGQACAANSSCCSGFCNGGICGSCVPKTCASLGDTCGSPPDGCGGTLLCGACVAKTCCFKPDMTSSCIDTVNDPTNCGGCGINCPVNQVCVNSTCHPPCADGLKDGQETDLDCGGPVCNKCPIGKACVVNADCTTGNCSGSPSTCH